MAGKISARTHRADRERWATFADRFIERAGDGLLNSDAVPSLDNGHCLLRRARSSLVRISSMRIDVLLFDRGAWKSGSDADLRADRDRVL